MSPSVEIAIRKIREMENYFNWNNLRIVTEPNMQGPVFLKANQRTGDIHIRIEHGLGEGILLTCQKEDHGESAKTIGPLPLNFFEKS